PHSSASRTPRHGRPPVAETTSAQTPARRRERLGTADTSVQRTFRHGRHLTADNTAQAVSAKSSLGTEGTSVKQTNVLRRRRLDPASPFCVNPLTTPRERGNSVAGAMA